jgi:hypothetical protein
MNPIARHVLIPQLVKHFGIHVGYIRNAFKVGIHLERPQVNARFYLNVFHSELFQFVCKKHGMFLRSPTEEIIVRNFDIRIVETVLFGKKVVDRSSTVTKNGMCLQKVFDNLEGPVPPCDCFLFLVPQQSSPPLPLL